MFDFQSQEQHRIHAKGLTKEVQHNTGWSDQFVEAKKKLKTKASYSVYTLIALVLEII